MRRCTRVLKKFSTFKSCTVRTSTLPFILSVDRGLGGPISAESKEDAWGITTTTIVKANRKPRDDEYIDCYLSFGAYNRHYDASLFILPLEKEVLCDSIRNSNSPYVICILHQEKLQGEDAGIMMITERLKGCSMKEYLQTEEINLFIKGAKQKLLYVSPEFGALFRSVVLGTHDLNKSNVITVPTRDDIFVKNIEVGEKVLIRSLCSLVKPDAKATGHAQLYKDQVFGASLYAAQSALNERGIYLATFQDLNKTVLTNGPGYWDDKSLCNHPFFWTQTQMISFYIEMSNLLIVRLNKNPRDLQLFNLVKNLCVAMTQIRSQKYNNNEIHHRGWQQELMQFKQDTKELGNYMNIAMFGNYGDRPHDLVRFIRNVIAHHREPKFKYFLKYFEEDISFFLFRMEQEFHIACIACHALKRLRPTLYNYANTLYDLFID